MTAKKKNNKKSISGNRLPVRAYSRKTLEKHFTIGKYYTLEYICEAVKEPFPIKTHERMRRLWKQIELSGMIWEKRNTSKFYLFKGYTEKDLVLAAYTCGKKKIADVYNKDSGGFINTDYLGYNELSFIYYDRYISELLIPLDEDTDMDDIDYKVIKTLNQIIRDRIYTIFGNDFKVWRENIISPEKNTLVKERRNQIIHAYKYENSMGDLLISDPNLTKIIDDVRRKAHTNGYVRGLYGHKLNPYKSYEDNENIHIYHSVWKIIFPEDVPKRYYHIDKKEIQDKLDKRLQRYVYRYLRSRKYKEEIRIDPKINRKEFDKLIIDKYIFWIKTTFAESLTDEELQNLKINDRRIDRIVMNEEETKIYAEDVIIGNDGDISYNEDFISYQYE